MNDADDSISAGGGGLSARSGYLASAPDSPDMGLFESFFSLIVPRVTGDFECPVNKPTPSTRGYCVAAFVVFDDDSDATQDERNGGCVS